MSEQTPEERKADPFLESIAAMTKLQERVTELDDKLARHNADAINRLTKE